MKQNYQSCMTVNCDIPTAYKALTTGIPEWWSVDYTGASVKPGDEFTVRFDKTHISLRLEETKEEEKIVWLCFDTYQDIPVADKTEWIGTSIIWELEPQGTSTKITMTHPGLTEDFECYAICVKGWTFFMHGSLRTYLNTQKGTPYADVQILGYLKS